MKVKKRKFKYKKKVFGHSELLVYKMVDYLNEEGGNGWELVYITESPFINEPTVICRREFIFKKEV